MIEATDKIIELINIGESENIEFKESFNDEALETIGAFSNAKGGFLLIGIQDSGKISGIQLGKKTLEDIANKIQEATDPRLQPSISKSFLEKKTIIMIQVASTSSVPVSVRGRYFRRVGRTNQRMSHEEIMQRFIARTGLSWDVYIENTATLSNLDDDQIEQFISATKEKGRLSIPHYIKNYDILRKLELIHDDKPTRAALLLFGKKPNSFFPSAFLKVGRFKSPTHILDDREFFGTLRQQLDAAMKWFRERLETEFVITDQLEREVHWEYPLKAIREAVINLLCHRDYNGAAHSQIRLYDDRLEFWNSGGLPPALSPEALFKEHDSLPRNRKIAEVFYYTDLIERWGSGTLRIIEELKIAGLPQPKFVSDSGHFRLTLYKQYFTADYLNKLGLSSRQVTAVAYLKEHGSISNTKYQSIAKVSKATATRELNLLKNKGILSTEGAKGRGVVYKLKGS